MSIGSILSKLTAGLSQRERSRGDSFKKVVRDICDGKEPPIDRVEKALAEAGRTPDDLAAEVARLQRRRELAAVAAREPEIERELKAIGDQAKGIDDELEKAIAAAEERKQPLQWQEVRLKEELRKVEPAKEELFKTAAAELRDRLQSVATRVAEAWARRNAKAKLLADTRDRKEELLGLAAGAIDGGEMQKEYTRDAALRDQPIAAHAAALAEIDRELAELKAEEEEIRREMLQA